MIVDNIEVIEPPIETRDIRAGTSRTIEYIIRNIGDHPLVDIVAEVQTIKKTGINKTGDTIFENTELNYAKVISKPDFLDMKKDGVIKVKIDVPNDYNEVVKNSDDRYQRTPFRLKLSIHSLEDIKEI